MATADPTPVTVTPEGHVDDVTCPCAPIVHPAAGLMHTTLNGAGPLPVEIPEELRDVVFTTFTHECAYGCTIQTTDGREQPHDCVGVTTIVDAIRGRPGATRAEREAAMRAAEALAPLIRERRHQAWLAGVRDGRTGGLLYGVPEDAAAIAAEDGVR
jgi:hypothetical protein